MPSKLSISQIFIPNHQQAANFVSAYQETVRTDDPVDLFLIVEIRGEKRSKIPKKREEYEKVAQTMARTLKQAYFAERIVTEATFEKALSAINNELSILGKNGVIGWYKRLNSLVAVQSKNVMYLSVTGMMSGLLLRKREFSQISESLSPGESPHPLKTFLNFASGALVENDCVMLTTTGLYNYLSLEKLRSVLSREELPQASKQLVATLKTDMGPQDSFAAFLCEFSAKPKLSDTELAPLISPAAHTIIEDGESLTHRGSKNLKLAKSFMSGAAKSGALFARWIWDGASTLYRRVLAAKPQNSRGTPGAENITAAGPKTTAKSGLSHLNFARNEKRRTYLIAFLLAAILLVINLIFFNFRNARLKLESESKQKIEAAAQALTNAEAAMIYNDENRARNEVAAAQDNLKAVKRDPGFQSKAEDLQKKIDALNRRLNKETAIEQVEALGNFQNTPDRLIKLPDGFLGFNSFTDSFEKLALPSGQNQSVAPDSPVPENLVAGVYLPALSFPVFLGNYGHVYKLDAAGGLKPLSPTSTAAGVSADMTGMALYDNKLYSLDRQNSQIARYAQNQNFFSNAAPWLKQAYDLTAARDLAVDGSIFALTGNTVAKFTLGAPQPFSMPNLQNDISGATRIHTEKSQNFIYIVDSNNARILLLNKQGGLEKQLISDKFSELADIWVDEGNKTIYALYGNTVGKFGY